MSTELLEQPATALSAFDPKTITYPVAEQKLKEIAHECKQLSINGVDDKTGYEIVHRKKIEVRDVITSIEDRRVELKAPALAFGKDVDSMAKSLMSILEPAKAHLQLQEDAYNADVKKRKAEIEAARQRITDERLARLQAIGELRNPTVIAAMESGQFEDMFAELKATYDAKQEAAAKEEAERKQREAEEAERLRAEREKLEADRAELAELRRKQEQEAAAERARLEDERRQQDAERQRIEAERRAADLEREKAEAAERARQEERDRIESERLADLQRAEQAERERERQEAMRPDREKILAYLNALLAVECPEVGADCQPYRNDALDRLQELVRDVREEMGQ